jgi:hypothetical protein
MGKSMYTIGMGHLHFTRCDDGFGVDILCCEHYKNDSFGSDHCRRIQGGDVTCSQWIKIKKKKKKEKSVLHLYFI